MGIRSRQGQCSWMRSSFAGAYIRRSREASRSSTVVLTHCGAEAAARLRRGPGKRKVRRPDRTRSTWASALSRWTTVGAAPFLRIHLAAPDVSASDAYGSGWLLDRLGDPARSIWRSVTPRRARGSMWCGCGDRANCTIVYTGRPEGIDVWGSILDLSCSALLPAGVAFPAVRDPRPTTSAGTRS